MAVLVSFEGSARASPTDDGGVAVSFDAGIWKGQWELSREDAAALADTLEDTELEETETGGIEVWADWGKLSMRFSGLEVSMQFG